ncbi:MAG: 4Fe-4S binding protein [Syntrophotaleaceae bacterium]
MGHLVGKDLYRRLGEKVDNLSVRAPWNDTLYAILKELYSAEEAELVVKMPYSLTPLDRLGRLTRLPEDRLRTLLDGLADKGLVLDLWVEDGYRYVPSPMVVGLFEFSMMRIGPDVDSKKLAGLFQQYLSEERGFARDNFAEDKQVSILRSLPHEEAFREGEYLEVLDYEKVDALLAAAERFAIGICSCRHTHLHTGTKECDVPLESCTSFDSAADYLIRHNLAKEISRSEMRDHFARSRDLGLVLNADNVQRNITFVCHCCKCCCHPLNGIRLLGYPHCVITSNYIAAVDADLCVGCGLCAEACPIDAISMVPASAGQQQGKTRQIAHVDTGICLGCGVCALKCNPGACRLDKRQQRVIHPETTFERILLQCLERGTLQNQLFDNPESLTHKFLRGLVGGFLRLPSVKRALMRDALRSRFLDAMKKGAVRQGKGWLTEL